MSADVAIRARGIVKRYGGVTAVDGLDLTVERGTCLGLLGPNGAGKTTTIEILEGLTAADAGELELLGLRWGRDARRIRERIGVQLQETVLPDLLRVSEVLELFASFYPSCMDEAEALALVELEEKRSARVRELSGGQRQRLALGCALIHRPEVLFLDEPTTGLDPRARRRLWAIVGEFKRRGGTVLLTTHYMEEAERLADRVLIVDRGRALREGTPRALAAELGAESMLELTVVRPGESGESGEGGEDGEPATPEALRAAEGWLAELPDVRSVRATEGRLHVGVGGVQRVLPRLTAAFEERGLALADLHVHRPTLEDVFVSLTGRGLDEEASEA